MGTADETAVVRRVSRWPQRTRRRVGETRLSSLRCSVINEGLSEIIGPFPVPPPGDKRDRNDDPRQEQRGHRYYRPSQTTAYIDYRDRK